MASVKTLVLIVLVVYCAYYFHDSDVKEVEAAAKRYSGSARYGARIRNRVRNTNTNYNPGQTVRTRVRNTNYNTGQNVRVRVRNSGYTRYSRYRMRPGWNWHTAATLGYIYGYSRYSSRRLYHRDREPSICTNRYDYTMNNGTHYELFICPKEFQDDDMVACCGPADRQHCCRATYGTAYRGNSRRSRSNSGSIIGTIVGLLILAGIIGLVVYCCYFKRKQQEKPAVKVEYKVTNVAPPPGGQAPAVGPGFSPPAPQAGPGYPPQGPPGEPVMPPQQPMYPPTNGPGYPPAPAPAAYGSTDPQPPPYPPGPDGGMAYSPPPGPAASPYPAPGNPPYPPQGPAYPPQPGPGY